MCLEDSENFIRGDGFYLGDTHRIAKDNANLGGCLALFG